jgi:hypothetical protein
MTIPPTDRSRRVRGKSLGILLMAASIPVGGAGAQLTDLSGQPDRETTPVARGTAQEGALFLLLPVGAQGVAMGRAMTSVPTQEGAFWNPAGLAFSRDSRILLYRGDHLAGEATAFSVLLSHEAAGTLGFSYQLLDVGDQELTDGTGQVRGSISVRSHQGVASFATRVVDRVAVGANFKIVQFRVTCRGECVDGGVTATTYAVDAGVQSTPLGRVPLRLGAMVAHLGPRLQVENAAQADPLPTRIRVSGGYDVLHHFGPGGDLNLWLTLEAEDRWRHPGHPSLYLGSEFSAGDRDVVFVRAGYIHSDPERTDGAAVGVGLRYERFDLGIAKSLARPALTGESEPVHVTLGILF